MLDIAYTLKRSPRARRVRIAVGADGVVVTAPQRVPARLVAQFVAEKSAWIHSARQRLRQNRRDWLAPAHVRQTNYAACRERARKFIRERVCLYNTYYQLVFRRIGIKRAASRWGSCSKQGNLNFHYRLLFLPIELADYVIVHELCHLKEMNHSNKFWRLVAERCPNYLERRRELRTFPIL